MSKLTTERLDEIANIKITEFSDGTDTANGAYQSVGSSEIVLMARQLLAYEQAAKNPIGYTDDEELRDLSRVGTAYIVNGEDVNIDVSDGRWFPVYLAPVLPKQPELIGMKVSIDTGSDNIGHRLFGEIVGTNDSNGVPMLCIEVTENNDDVAAPAQPVIPEQQQPIAYIFKHPAGRLFWSLTDESNQGQADVIPVYADPHELKIPPAIEPDYEVIKGILPTANPDEYACCIAADMWNACRAEMLKAQPVSEPYKLPSGYALVPCKLTEENGAKSCMIGKFIEQTEISCPECFGDDECETCDGSGTIEVTAHVSWTTIKDIWAKGIEHFAAAPAQESE